jgi:hypothetical protein
MGLPGDDGELSMGRGRCRQGVIALTTIRGSWLDHTSLTVLYEGVQTRSLLRHLVGDVSHYGDAVQDPIPRRTAERSGACADGTQ